MVHRKHCLRDSIENKENLTWNKSVPEAILKIIHENNIAPAKGRADKGMRINKSG